jgi:hypothetical protein
MIPNTPWFVKTLVRLVRTYGNLAFGDGLNAYPGTATRGASI